MPGVPDIQPMGLEAFLDWERRQSDRFEFIDGVIRPMGMASGTLRHNRLAQNAAFAIRMQFRGGCCAVYQEGAKVRTGTRVYYPDVVATCAAFEPDSDTVAGPVLIIEILSPSTAPIDRAEKWFGYQTIPTLQAYLLVAQDRYQVEVFRRHGDGWDYRIVEAPAAEVMSLESPRLTLSMADLYEDVTPGPAAH